MIAPDCANVLAVLALIERDSRAAGASLNTQRVQQMRAAFEELIEAHKEGMYEIVTILEDYTLSASKANALNTTLRRMDAALARVGGGAA